MEKQYVLHMLTPEKNLSPFDVNMALDAGWVLAIPYTRVEVTEVRGMVQNAIHSRSAKGRKNTGIFIGGKNFKQTLDFLHIAETAMVPPFKVSVLADPSGAFTSAASIVVIIERKLQNVFNTRLQSKKMLILEGTGPVAQTTAILAAKAGADVTFVNSKPEQGQALAAICNKLLQPTGSRINTASHNQLSELIRRAEVILCARTPVKQLLGTQSIAAAEALKICVDFNIFPPIGIEGLHRHQDGEPVKGTISGAIGIGALTIGNLKYKTQILLLKQMIECTTPIILHYEHAYSTASGLTDS